MLHVLCLLGSSGCFVLGTDLEASLLSFEKLDRASPDLWPEQCKFFISLCQNQRRRTTATLKMFEELSFSYNA